MGILHSTSPTAWLLPEVRPLTLPSSQVLTGRHVDSGLSRSASSTQTCAAVVVGITWISQSFRSPRRRRGQRLLVAAQAGQEEYLEDFDALSAELNGKALLIGWDPGRKYQKRMSSQFGPNFSAKESLEELETLCKTLGLEVKETFMQQWRPTFKSFPIGKGKLESMRVQAASDPELGVIIFDMDMPPRVLLTVKGMVAPEGECVVMDRTSLILRIFSQRASTREAQLQVQLASQQYMLPRLRYFMTTGAGMEAKGGSAGGAGGGGGQYMKGAGESQLNLDRNLLGKKMAGLRKKLEQVRVQRADVRARSAAMKLPTISLVGYTNAGKSTLMNKLCQKEQVSAKDRLFETLDPTRKRVSLESNRDVLLVDTVGFIQRLPAQLIMGFRATLEEVTEADVILHVVDVSSSTAAQQVTSVLVTLRDLPGWSRKIPQLLVFNKTDKVEGEELDAVLEGLRVQDEEMAGIVGHMQVSAMTGAGLPELAEEIERVLVEHTNYGSFRMNLLIPYTEPSEYAALKNGKIVVKINGEEHTNDGYLLDITASADSKRILQRFEVSQEKAAEVSLR